MKRIRRAALGRFGFLGFLGTLGFLGILNSAAIQGPQSASPALAAHPQERHLRNLRQLTVEGENAEAYLSADNRQLIFQGHTGPTACDQIFIMNLATGQRRMVSTGKGRTTCGYFFPDGKRILYASTHLGGDACPPVPDMSQGYVWPIYESYDIFTANPDGTDLKRLTNSPGYDAEVTIARDGKKIVFTSVRDGDLDIYTMDADGKNVKRLTTEPGYDGGAFFSPDGKQIVYRGHHPADPKEIAEFHALLRQGLVRPSKLELFVMNADGTNKRQLTHNGAANFAPFFHPDGKRIIFSSNVADQRGREFDLFLIHADGTGFERVTYEAGFDGFPMFTSDGKRLVFDSNRHSRRQGDTNLFIADWVE